MPPHILYEAIANFCDFGQEIPQPISVLFDEYENFCISVGKYLQRSGFGTRNITVAIVDSYGDEEKTIEASSSSTHIGQAICARGRALAVVLSCLGFTPGRKESNLELSPEVFIAAAYAPLRDSNDIEYFDIKEFSEYVETTACTRARIYGQAPPQGI